MPDSPNVELPESSASDPQEIEASPGVGPFVLPAVPASLGSAIEPVPETPGPVDPLAATNGTDGLTISGGVGSVVDGSKEEGAAREDATSPGNVGEVATGVGCVAGGVLETVSEEATPPAEGNEAGGTVNH